MAKERVFDLVKDQKGAIWDLILYVPTVLVLSLLSFQFWFSGNQSFTYILAFLTTFIFLIGFNRIAKTRLMILSSAPVSFSVSKQGVSLSLRSGDTIDLSKDVRFFSDFAGKSIGLAGVDLEGRKRQFVFNRGQFPSATVFDDAKASLRVFK